MDINEILNIEPYSLDKEHKRSMLNARLRELTRVHHNACAPYKRMMDAVGLDMNNLPEYDALPFLPVRLFKELELRSCAQEDVIKTMTSSGTTG